MVTKQMEQVSSLIFTLILAKNHMVTKQVDQDMMLLQSLILAKNHMVTKLCLTFYHHY